MGWMISKENGRVQIGHTGAIPGYIANFMYFPKDSTTIILLANYQDIDGRKLSKDLVSVTFGEPYKLPVQKKPVTLSRDILNKYKGEYQLENGFSVSVLLEGDKLFAQAKGDPQKIELIAESEYKFYLKGPETEIEFLNEENSIKYMFINMQGGKKLTRMK
jgi:uncharacterized protein YneR